MAVLLYHWRAERFGERKVLSRLGILFEPYRSDCFWFEIVILARRVVTICLLALLSQTRAVSFMWVAISNCLWLLTQMSLVPYKERVENWLETIALSVLAIASIVLVEVQPPFNTDTAIGLTVMIVVTAAFFALRIMYLRLLALVRGQQPTDLLSPSAKSSMADERPPNGSNAGDQPAPQKPMSLPARASIQMSASSLNGHGNGNGTGDGGVSVGAGGAVGGGASSSSSSAGGHSVAVVDLEALKQAAGAPSVSGFANLAPAPAPLATPGVLPPPMPAYDLSLSLHSLSASTSIVPVPISANAPPPPPPAGSGAAAAAAADLPVSPPMPVHVLPAAAPVPLLPPPPADSDHAAAPPAIPSLSPMSPVAADASTPLLPAFASASPPPPPTSMPAAAFPLPPLMPSMSGLPLVPMPAPVPAPATEPQPAPQ
jgi:hypothetical protein